MATSINRKETFSHQMTRQGDMRKEAPAMMAGKTRWMISTKDLLRRSKLNNRHDIDGSSSVLDTVLVNSNKKIGKCQQLNTVLWVSEKRCLDKTLHALLDVDDDLGALPSLSLNPLEGCLIA